VPEPPPAGGEELDEQQDEYVLEQEPDGRYRIVAKRPRATKPEH